MVWKHVLHTPARTFSLIFTSSEMKFINNSLIFVICPLRINLPTQRQTGGLYRYCLHFYGNKVEIMWSTRRQEKNKEQIKIHWFISNVRNWQTKLDDLYINAELILNQQKSLMLTNIDIGLKRTKTYRSSIILFNKPQQLQWHIQYLNTFKISSSLTFKKKKTQICKQIY